MCYFARLLTIEEEGEGEGEEGGGAAFLVIVQNTTSKFLFAAGSFKRQTE